MDPNDPFVFKVPTPTAARPLLGLTVLVVEDSRFACEAIRLLCQHSGARIRRADCLRSARRHLRVYRPSVAIIDLGLPDGSGLDLIRELAVGQPTLDVILATSGNTHLEGSAIQAGRARISGQTSQRDRRLSGGDFITAAARPSAIWPARGVK